MELLLHNKPKNIPFLKFKSREQLNLQNMQEFLCQQFNTRSGQAIIHLESKSRFGDYVFLICGELKEGHLTGRKIPVLFVNKGVKNGMSLKLLDLKKTS